MAKAETQEQKIIEPALPPQTARRADQCPGCGAAAGIVSEMIINNCVVRQRRCAKCDVCFTE